MKTSQVEVSRILVPEVRVTAVYDDELRELLKDTMKAMGMLTPVVVVQTSDGYRLVDGLHRLQEVMAQGGTMVDAVVYEGEEKDTLLMNLILNRTRGKTRASEMVKVIGALYQEYEMDPDAIKEKTGLSRDYIEKLITISQASESVKDLLDREIIGVGHAFEISRLPAEIQQDEVCAKVQVWRYTVKDLKELVDETLRLMEAPPGAPAQVATRPATKYYCEGCRQEMDPRYLRPVMLCPQCFGVVWREREEHVSPPATTAEGPEKAS